MIQQFGKKHNICGREKQGAFQEQGPKFPVLEVFDDQNIS
jgi:hypothetical protein